MFDRTRRAAMSPCLGIGVLALGALAVTAVAGVPSVAGAQEMQAPATANMVNREGDLVGKVSLTPLAQGVQVVLSGNALPPGVHAFHIHQTGTCDPGTGFKSAGGHFNPTGASHGWNNEKGHHAGDLPNVHVGENGIVAVEFFATGLTLDGGDGGLFDDDGAAVVMHQGADDYATDPAGAAGERIACGVIKQDR